jgi:hypothetical protein
MKPKEFVELPHVGGCDSGAGDEACATHAVWFMAAMRDFNSGCPHPDLPLDADRFMRLVPSHTNKATPSTL